MGILDRFGINPRRPSSNRTGWVSPFSDGFPNQVVFQDLFGDLFGEDAADALSYGRAEAMSVPAIAKARNLLVSTIAQWPLKALDGRGELKTQPAFLYRTNSDVSPQERLVYTVDDGFFYGLSLWLTERGEPDKVGRRAITNAEYCPWDDWSVEDGKILVNQKPVDESEILLFNFWTDGILVNGRRTIRQAIDLEKSVAGKVRNPVPIMELRITDDTQLDQTVAEAYVKTWAAARRNQDGAVSMTPPGMELHVHGEVSPELFVDGRNAIRTDVGSFANIRASMLDGTAGVDSLTYKTSKGERNAFFDIDVPFWTGPIEARLSQDDVLPRGQRVRFDKYESDAAEPTPTGAPTED